MSDTRVLPYGSWPSPLSAADVARGGVRLSFVALHDGTAWWEEGRATEGGRVVVVRRDAEGTTRDAVPASWNVRTRAHEFAFEGEQHGFRREETQVAALEASCPSTGRCSGSPLPGCPPSP
jgi:hypothetical protein